MQKNMTGRETEFSVDTMINYRHLHEFTSKVRPSDTDMPQYAVYEI